jgi:hypothetical protein
MPPAGMCRRSQVVRFLRESRRKAEIGVFIVFEERTRPQGRAHQYLWVLLAGLKSRPDAFRKQHPSFRQPVKPAEW